VKQIRGLLTDRGAPGLRDLALFSTAIDTMLHAHDLLPSRRRAESQWLNPPPIEVARARGMPPVRCALSKATANALEKWISSSGKKRTDYLFPGGDPSGSRPLSARQLNRLLKVWIVDGIRSHRLQHRIFASDEGSSHFEGHRRFADGSGTLGTCANREHSEISRS
jgi:integrase